MNVQHLILNEYVWPHSEHFHSSHIFANRPLLNSVLLNYGPNDNVRKPANQCKPTINRYHTGLLIIPHWSFCSFLFNICYFFCYLPTDESSSTQRQLRQANRERKTIYPMTKHTSSRMLRSHPMWNRRHGREVRAQSIEFNLAIVFTYHITNLSILCANNLIWHQPPNKNTKHPIYKRANG